MTYRQFYRRRWRHPVLVYVAGLFLIGYLTLFQTSQKSCRTSHKQETLISPSLGLEQLDSPIAFYSRHLLNAPKTNSSPSNETKKQAQFPEDLFTLEQRQHGAVLLHVMGLAYMFVALAIVCDEFFVPSLDVITEKLEISEDVAGATFMAAGGSAPELFTSVIGVFISYDDVGIGTIVGSAVFNILFVISMCAIFSKTVLNLTWWPLFRDVTFYAVSLIILIICFIDSIITWYEASILLSCYFAYVIFMKFNEKVERAVKKLLNRSKSTRVGSTDHLVPSGMAKRRMSTPIVHGGSKFRHGLLQLMIHSIDPMHDGKLDEKASQVHAIASLRVLLDATKANGTCPPGTTAASGADTSTTTNNGCCSACPTCPACVACPNCSKDTKAMSNDPSANNLNSETTLSTVGDKDNVHGLDPLTKFQNFQSVSFNSLANGAELADGVLGPDGTPLEHTCNMPSNSSNISTILADSGAPTVGPTAVDAQQQLQNQPPEPLEEEGEAPLDMSWPDTARKRVSYILLMPLVFPLWFTLPDVRRPEKRKYFYITFVGSILWIAIFSYLMVWWASLVGDTAGIPNEVMGLTFLAAGTSIPDLITSVLVARKGFGDMAVSSSVGSNIFDVTVGLPLPWLLSSLIFGPVEVSSGGMACSIFILFLMLLFVIVSIAAFKWKMNISLAVVMFLLYFVFVAVSLILEYEIVSCSAIVAHITGKSI